MGTIQDITMTLFISAVLIFITAVLVWVRMRGRTDRPLADDTSKES